ncbi:hypothetical protein B9Z55_027302 [Caenorhabditis nigoni]|uniref:Uncharacterized protein n=1 Tax=Caenorhabditis nigoni TaxID=1611254 RepID=A0A2G5SFW0_9PELO|nr:hypothetical protein B9Z55_027302 [Caenorhabditis nigoni]
MDCRQDMSMFLLSFLRTFSWAGDRITVDDKETSDKLIQFTDYDYTDEDGMNLYTPVSKPYRSNDCFFD